MERILEMPEWWQPHLHGTRRYLLRRYPYGVIYRHDPVKVEVIAIAHQHRRPGHWKRR